MKDKCRTTAVAALALLVVLVGCTASPPQSQDEGDDLPGAPPGALADVSIEEYEDVRAILDYDHSLAETPLDEFSAQRPEFTIQVLHAIAVLADGCMEKQGHAPTAAERDWTPFLDNEDRTYGIWSVAYASKYGRDLAPEAGAAEMEIDGMDVEELAAYETCINAARDELADELVWLGSPETIEVQIRFTANELTLASDDGQQAKGNWVACIEAAGVVVLPEDGMPVDAYRQKGKDAEIPAFVTAAECARSTGAVQTLYDLQARYEAALIDAHAAEVDAYIERSEEVLAVLQDAIDG